jgi:hypothetical protein
MKIETTSPEMLAELKGKLKEGCAWYAYANHDLGSRDVGHVKFLLVGPGCTFEQPPSPLPGMDWRYYLEGKLDLESGECVAVKSGQS